MARTKQHQQQVDAVNAAYKALHAAYNHAASVDMLWNALEQLGMAFVIEPKNSEEN